MSLITVVPSEIIEYILEDKNIFISDVVRFSLTCKSLYKTIRCNNKLWKTKFFQRWPSLKEVYEEENKSDGKVLNWLEEIQANIECRRTLAKRLSQMSKKYYKEKELSDSELRDFDDLFCVENGAPSSAYHFLVDKLVTLIEQPAMSSNLTERYYAFKVIRYLKQCHLKKEWVKFVNLPKKEQILERGATLVAQWSQPNRRVSYMNVSKTLDTIAEETKKLLKEQHPMHSMFSVSSDRFKSWKYSNIDNNEWSPLESRQVLAAMCNILFGRLGFHGNSEMYYSSDSSFIDRVLERKRGVPITLAIIFESVARRLGVRCEAISFPSHFLLRWKERYDVRECEEIENFYIDVFNGGRFLTKSSCPMIGGNSRCPIEKYNVYSAATATEVVMRMANNLEVAARQHTHLNGRAARLRSALELRHMIQPYDPNTILQLGRFYMFYHMDLTDLVGMLQRILQNVEATSRTNLTYYPMLQMFQQQIPFEKETKVQRRDPRVEFAVGLIMRHKTHGYLCVITGWDVRCDATAEWMAEMHIETLEYGAEQPFYNVFVEDGSFRYAAQENLFLAPDPNWINHYDIGRYFCKFANNHYVPNEEKAQEYPEDEEVRNAILLDAFKGL